MRTRTLNKLRRLCNLACPAEGAEHQSPHGPCGKPQNTLSKQTSLLTATACQSPFSALSCRHFQKVTDACGQALTGRACARGSVARRFTAPLARAAPAPRTEHVHPHRAVLFTELASLRTTCGHARPCLCRPPKLAPGAKNPDAFSQKTANIRNCHAKTLPILRQNLRCFYNTFVVSFKECVWQGRAFSCPAGSRLSSTLLAVAKGLGLP